MAEPPGRVLGVDPGQARIGLALADGLGISVRPLPALVSRGQRADLDRLVALVREERVAIVVVGLPLHLSGEENPGTVRARRLTARLRARLGREVRVELWDERLSTVEAERLLADGEVGRSRRGTAVDAIAASLIVRGYLEARGAGGDRGL